MPCDMKAHWAVYACGGIHDKEEKFCHCCHERQQDRQRIYQFHVLPGPSDGGKEQWTLPEIAALLDINMRELTSLNLHSGASELNMRKYHIDSEEGH
eukprot:1248685-Rhodomonas_salina.1